MGLIGFNGSWDIQRISWNNALIVDIERFPTHLVLFGKRIRIFSSTVNAFGGIPGVIVRDASGRDGDEVYRRCLLVHERWHWAQWAVVTAPVVATTLMMGWPWWTQVLSAFLFPALYVAVPPLREWVEDFADKKQLECEARE